MAIQLSEDNQSLLDFFKNQVSERDRKIVELEAALRQSEPQHITVEREKIIDSLETRLKQAEAGLKTTEALKQENAGLRAEVNNLLVQRQPVPSKGLAWMPVFFIALLSGVLGFVAKGWMSKPTGGANAAFEKFKEANLFNFEYAINQGKFDQVESSLKTLQESSENASIRSEIEFARKLIGASRRKIGEGKTTGGVDGFSVEPTPETIKVSDKPKKTLSAGEIQVSIRGEANTTSEKKGVLKPGQSATVWDRTNYIDKLNTTENGEKVRLEDYWYKIETSDGIEGWVFGHFTSRSLNRKFIEAPVTAPTTPTVPATTPTPPAEGN